MCVVFFNVPHGKKDDVMPNPLKKEEGRRVYNCDDKCLSGTLNFQKYVKYKNFVAYNLYNSSESFTHWSVIMATFPRPETCRKKTNCDWLYRHVGQMALWVGLGQ